MKNTETLYNEIPPSKLRTKEKPFICSDISPFWLNFFDAVFFGMIEKTFSSVRIKNAQNFANRNPEMSNIFYSTHTCWWDGIIGYYLCRKILDINVRMMIEQLYQFPILSKVGAFSVDKRSPQSIMKALNYSIKFLNDPEMSLWIFPQGVVRPPDSRPVKFGSGISYICQKLQGVNLIPIGFKCTFLREDKPEVLIDVGEPITLTGTNLNKKEFTYFLEQDLTELLDKQCCEISQGDISKYETIYKKNPSMFKKIESYFKSF